jgi:hypothetical protein
MVKSILAGLLIGAVLIMVSNGFWPALLFLLLLAFFMDWSGDGDGRQRWLD